jgi:FKBP-type peptidyl-prolyl cis-trans isomerase
MSAFLVAGCGKDDAGCKNPDPAGQEAAIQSFIAAKGMKATRSSSGLYYEIVRAGSTTNPKLTSIIFCTYLGTLLDDRVFDRQSNPGFTGFQLNSLIPGWQEGIPLIGKGGTIKLVVPSDLAYGCQDRDSLIRPNTPLYFEINLVDFFN